jgi:glutathione reductase (NADPH)
VPNTYDLVVIGTGTAGGAAADRCRKAGWRVAVVDDEPYGGTCALRGCDPKKVLVDATALADAHKRMLGHGLTGEAHIDWSTLMQFTRSFTDPVPANREAAFQKDGIDTYHGVARFLAHDRLSVGEQELHAEHFVVASGAEPQPLEIPGEEYLTTSTEFLELEALPRRIVFVGAGYIAFEFAHIACRVGAEVVMLGRGAALAQFDQDLVAQLVRHSTSLRIDIRLGLTVTDIERNEKSFSVHFRGPGAQGAVDADLVVHAAGRVPKTKRLELERANVAVDARGAVKVNEYLQSVSNPRVYAAGDAVLPPGSLPLTPVAAHEGLVVAANLLHGNTSRPDYRGIPSVVFTTPPLARVGLTEDEARQQRLDFRVQSEDTAQWFSNRHVRETVGHFKTLVENGTNRVLGAHLLGRHADEVINVFALAIRFDLDASQLSHMIYSYPTSASDIASML